MGWERKKRGHECRVPFEQPLLGRRIRTGDAWRCRRCGVLWIVHVLWIQGRYQFSWQLAPESKVNP